MAQFRELDPRDGPRGIESESPEQRARSFLDTWSGSELLKTIDVKNMRIDPMHYFAGLTQIDRKVLIEDIGGRISVASDQISELLHSTDLTDFSKDYIQKCLLGGMVSFRIPNMLVPKQVLGFDEEHPLGIFEPGSHLGLVEYRLFLLGKYIDRRINPEGPHAGFIIREEEKKLESWIDALRHKYGMTHRTTHARVMMGMSGPDLLPPIERVDPPIKARFYKLGGTWDMVEKDGRFIGTGNLDDAELSRLEESLGIHRKLSPSRLAHAERRLAHIIYRRMKQTMAEPVEVDKHFAPWCPNFGKLATGPFIPLYSGDSSHLRSSLVAPIVSILLEEAIKDPETPIIGAQGTDTADTAILSILDALVFDTKLPAFIFTGANRSHREENSDAPANFLDLASLANYDIRKVNLLPVGEYDYKHPESTSGVFWIFHDNIYPASDLNKIDPAETREIEGTSTFFSPHSLAVNKRYFTDDETFWGRFFKINWRSTSEAPPVDHISRRVSMEEIFDALNSVHTISLDDQNAVWQDVAEIRDPKIKAVIISAHGLGNVNNVIRKAAVEAAREGKMVIAVSRSLIGEITAKYAGSLLDANNAELDGTGAKILSSNKLNKAVSRAVAVRAILEGRSQQQTQELIEKYCLARKLL